MGRFGWAAIALALALLPAAPAAEAGAAEGWGPRLGVADDPDQLLLGAHLDLGELAPRLRFVPDVELGLGDDHTVLALTAPVHYRWEHLRETKVVPYVGGGVTAALVERDRKGRGRGNDDDDTELELALRAIGGAEWQLAGRRALRAEVHLVFGDVHDVQLVVGWLFRR